MTTQAHVPPDRLTISTCIGCGAMGRNARCDGDCSEHRLPLVDAGDFDALCAAVEFARATVKPLGAVVRSLAQGPPTEGCCEEAYAALRVAARAALDDAEPTDVTGDWGSPAVRIGWWCSRCGNVDAPEPCIDVCVWRDADWVSADLYAAAFERGADDLRAGQRLRALLRQVVAVVPRDGRCRDTWRAFANRADRLPASAAKRSTAPQ